MPKINLKLLPIHFTLCVGVVSHLLLFICLIKDPLKCFRNSATYLITNLALSDFITCTVGLLKLFLGKKFPTVGYILDTVMLVSLFSIFSIAIHRYILTVHPFRHRALLNGKRIAIWISSIWLLCFCSLVKDLTFGPLYLIDRVLFNATFIVIASVTFFIYIFTYISLKKRGREISQQRTQSRNRVSEEEFLKTIIIVAFVQIITLAPTCIDRLITGWSVSYIDDIDNILMENMIFFEMYCLNFAINPFLYIWRLKNYRKTFLLLFCENSC